MYVHAPSAAKNGRPKKLDRELGERMSGSGFVRSWLVVVGRGSGNGNCISVFFLVFLSQTLT
jgi:hypothetical protein